MVITDHQVAWLKEFLLERSLTDEDKLSSLEIVDTFTKLWQAVHAGRRFRNLRTNESLTHFCATLEHLKNDRQDN